ncbi:MAG: cysteine-rich small domain-containing protein [Clostridiales bacterium]|jgi:Zn-finger protein|nr:cysteine-rich small domain-containing protein [Clostridiales bacterium]
MKPCIDWKDKGFSFFNNTNCEYFPCHETDEADAEKFNCLFCFCPLYDMADCGGAFKILKNGYKDCSACIVPHEKENYGLIVERLRCAGMQGESLASNGEKNGV